MTELGMHASAFETKHASLRQETPITFYTDIIIVSDSGIVGTCDILLSSALSHAVLSPIESRGVCHLGLRGWAEKRRGDKPDKIPVSRERLDHTCFSGSPATRASAVPPPRPCSGGPFDPKTRTAAVPLALHLKLNVGLHTPKTLSINPPRGSYSHIGACGMSCLYSRGLPKPPPTPTKGGRSV